MEARAHQNRIVFQPRPSIASQVLWLTFSFYERECKSAATGEVLPSFGTTLGIAQGKSKQIELNSVNCDRPGECSPEKDCLR